MRFDNPVKEKLRAGEVVFGAFVPMPSPDIVEIIALAGFDFALLDAEHGRISPDDAYPMILAAEARDIPAFVRIGENDRQVVLKYLDLGVSGVMIPQTNSPELVRDAIQAMRYAPAGLRGLAGGRTFDYGQGKSMPTSFLLSTNGYSASFNSSISVRWLIWTKSSPLRDWTSSS